MGGGDRASLRLRPVDEEIIAAVAAANPRTVVAIVAAGAVITEAWRDEVPAVLVMWYAGMEGGHALADVLTGGTTRRAGCPFSIPTSEDHLPFFDRDATSITYDRFHGQRLLDRLGVEAAFPHGLRAVVHHLLDRVDAVVVEVSRATVPAAGHRAQHRRSRRSSRRAGLRPPPHRAATPASCS